MSNRYEVLKKNLALLGNLFVKKNLGVKGDLVLGGDLLDRTGQDLFQPKLLFIRRQEDLSCHKITSSFIPILISPNATLENLNLNLCCLYNRSLQILNLSTRIIQLIVPVNGTTQTFNLTSGRHAEITIFANENLTIIHGVVNIPNQPVPGPRPPTLMVTSATFIFTSEVVLQTNLPQFNVTREIITVAINDQLIQNFTYDPITGQIRFPSNIFVIGEFVAVIAAGQVAQAVIVDDS